MSTNGGFIKRQRLQGLDELKKTPPVSSPDVGETARPEMQSMEKIDAIATKAGFVSREPVERKVMRQGRLRSEKSQNDSLTIRCRTETLNRFKTYCIDQGMSQGEALEVILNKAGIP